MAKEKVKSTWALLGTWSFVIGLLVAILVGVFASTALPGPTAATVLLILGLIVGLLNINDREIMPFLVACIALMIAGTISTVIPFAWIPKVLANIVIFILPAAIIASLKAIYVLAKD